MKKPCPGCKRVLISVSNKYCESCSIKYDARTKRRHKQYSKGRTDTKEQGFYNSSSWRRIKERVKFKDGGACLLCKEFMDRVHHIEELKEAYDKRLDEDNLISLCESCHQKVHKQYKKSQKDKENMQNELKKLIKEFRD